MKVVKIINSLGFGGIERVFEIVALYYRGDKDDLVFLVLGSGGAAEVFIKSLGFKVLVLGAKTRIPNPGLIVRLVRLLRIERPDVVHTCGAEANFHGIIAAKLAGVRVRIGEEIGIPSHSVVANNIFRAVYGYSSAIIAVSHAVGDYLILNKEIKKDKLRVIYNPVDVAKFDHKGSTKQGEFIIVTVSRLNAIKNLGALISVFSRLNSKHPFVKLWLIGEGEERSKLESLSSSLGMLDHIKFWGFQHDPSGLLSQANVFMLPSFSEGHGVAMIEAMVSGVPVIATKVGGPSEIIEDGENGWLIDPYNDDEMLEKLELVLRLPETSKAVIASRAKERALAMFSPEEYLRNLNSLYCLLSK